MTQSTIRYLRNRVFKLNVGFLLAFGSGQIHDSVLDIPAVHVADDLTLAYLHGPLRLSRTKEGVLVQAQLEVGVSVDCSRCLDPVAQSIIIDLEELFAYPASADTEFSISEGAVLDLAPLLRDEILIATSHKILCHPDCQGLCPVCGTNLNHESCRCELETIDPRMAILKELLDT